MKTLKVCIDLGNKIEPGILGLYHAYCQRSTNIHTKKCKQILTTNPAIEQTLMAAKTNNDFKRLLTTEGENKLLLQKLALYKGNLWANGKKIKVKFLGGTAFLQENVINYAKKWEQFGNFSFEFSNSNEAEIRVAFISGAGSWSYIGTDALTVTNQLEPTMNFGWFDQNTAPAELSRTIIHEFGHCLGCIHEHQSPAAKIKWNKPKLYEYYAKTQSPPWDKETVDKNIINKFNQEFITNSVFDPSSIMLYPIPAEFTLDGFSVGWNNKISAMDKKFIALAYPKP